MDRPRPLEQWNLELVGYHDLGGNAGFKMAMQEVDGRWFMYLGHFSRPGWSILDVTDPTQPDLLHFIAGPAGTWACQVQVADGLMLGGLEKPHDLLASIYPKAPFEEGVLVWNVREDPAHPRLLAHYKTGGTGTHRNFYSGGRYAYLAANPAGYQGLMLIVLDLADPANPREAAHWSWPGQHAAAGETPEFPFYFHGPAYVVGHQAFLSYGRVGMLVLDVANPAHPELLSRLSFGDMGSSLGCHTALPIPSRNLAVVNSEAIIEGYGDALNYAFVVDVSDPRAPRIISSLPPPHPRANLPYRNYYEKGGRFGPHNQHHYQGQRALADLHDTVFLTYFNAGLRAYDISDPYTPKETAYFVCEDPTMRLSPMPQQALVTQFEDVLVDSRGFIYCTDKNYGLFVLRYAGNLV